MEGILCHQEDTPVEEVPWAQVEAVLVDQVVEWAAAQE